MNVAAGLDGEVISAGSRGTERLVVADVILCSRRLMLSTFVGDMFFLFGTNVDDPFWCLRHKMSATSVDKSEQAVKHHDVSATIKRWLQLHATPLRPCDLATSVLRMGVAQKSRGPNCNHCIREVVYICEYLPLRQGKCG